MTPKKDNSLTYQRLLTLHPDRSALLLGPRGTGKSWWLRSCYPNAVYLNLLENDLYRRLLAHPEYLARSIPLHRDWVVIDEVQLIPELLNEVHRLIEEASQKFLLSGSSARKLKRKGVNLLAGRALTHFMHPLTERELGSAHNFDRVLTYGLLPEVWRSAPAKEYLESYVTTYLKEEVQQEGLTRNLAGFSRFLEVASFSQAEPLNVSGLAQELGIDNKTAENYFTILEDLLLAIRIPVFSKRAKRAMYKRAKFFLFDVGIYRTIRPKGPLDTPELIDGAALETLFLQQLRAYNDYYKLGFSFYYWRTLAKQEVDLVLYGEHGLIAIEVKRTASVRMKDLSGLVLFLQDYPMAKGIVYYGGTARQIVDGITFVPHQEGLEYFLSLVPFGDAKDTSLSVSNTP